jgi:hypothetical protein
VVVFQQVQQTDDRQLSHFRRSRQLPTSLQCSCSVRTTPLKRDVHRACSRQGLISSTGLSVFLKFSLFSFQGLSIYRPIIYGNTAEVLTPEEREVHPSREHTHRWTVALRSAASAENSDIVGGADDLGYFIRRVTFKLHETYPNPSRSKYPRLPSTINLI